MTYDPTPAAVPIRQRRFDDATPSKDIEKRTEETRSLRRLKAVKSARAVISSSGSGIDCVVRSLSPIGARLTFAEPVNLPERFELYLLTENARVGVSLIWSKGLDVGVEFEKPLDWLSKHFAPKRF